MNFKRLFAILLALSMLLLAGCGAKSEMAGNGGTADMSSPESGELGYETEVVPDQGMQLPENQKLIRRIWLTAETEALDTLLSHVEQKVAALGGYMEAREIHNYNANNRMADLTIRIPAEKLDQFTDLVEEKANVTSTTETTENITLSYVAVESRMKALETEQTRLLELLAEAENMTEILQIEERLTKVRTELEQVTSQLRLYDNQVSYGTIHLTLHEVKEYTEEEPEGFFERIGNGLMNSIKSLGTGFKELLIFLIVALPYLAVIALIILLIVLHVKRRRKKNAAKKAKKETEG